MNTDGIQKWWAFLANIDQRRNFKLALQASIRLRRPRAHIAASIATGGMLAKEFA